MGNTTKAAPAWTIRRGDGPLVASAIHDGHRIRDDAEAAMAISDDQRRYEEDPYTGEWTVVAPNRIVVHASRFELDLNRPREEAVYRKPEDSWGISVWENGVPERVLERSLALYDAFYNEIRAVFEDLERRHGRFVVYDLHSYNHRRGGPRQPPDDARESPEINIGTGSMDRDGWSDVVDAFADAMTSARVLGRPMDVRENVRFTGGHFARWVHETFPDSGCCLAIEVKKFYMDEWTGEPDRARIEAVGAALAGTVAPVLEALGAS